MTTCEQIQEQLPAFQEGDLAAAQAAVVQAHLDACAACAGVLQALAASWAMLDELPGVEVSPSFNHRFWQRVEREKVPWWQQVRLALHGMTRGPVRALAVLAVMLIIVTGTSLWTSSRPTVPVHVDYEPAHYDVMGDVGDDIVVDDQASPAPTPAADDQKIDHLLEEMPLDGSGPQS